MSITKILQGIDRCEVEYEDGWWETSSDATFGLAKLFEAQDYECGLLQRIAELEAQLADAKKANQWQPIETAPKGVNGYSWMLLAWGLDGDTTIGYGMHANGKFYASATFHRPGTGRRFCIDEIEVNPTHWMPSPAIQAEGKA